MAAPVVYNYNNQPPQKLIQEEEKQPPILSSKNGRDEPKKMFEYESSDHKPKFDPTGVAIGGAAIIYGSGAHYPDQ